MNRCLCVFASPVAILALHNLEHTPVQAATGTTHNLVDFGGLRVLFGVINAIVCSDRIRYQWWMPFASSQNACLPVTLGVLGLRRPLCTNAMVPDNGSPCCSTVLSMGRQSGPRRAEASASTGG